MSRAQSSREWSKCKPTRLSPWIGSILLGLLLFAAATSLAGAVHATSSTDCSPTPEFNVDVSPDHLILRQGMTASAKVTVTPKNGFTRTVKLAAVNTPPEITNPIFNPATLNLANGVQTSTASFGTSSTAAIGLYSLDINATTNGSLYHYTSISIRIPGPEIGISSNKPLLNLQQGYSDAATVAVKSLYGFTGTLDLTVSVTSFHARTPPTASILPTSVLLLDGMAKTVDLNVFADQYATPGFYTVQIVAMGSSATALNSTQVLVTIQGPDFTLEANPPALIIPPFSSKAIPLEVNSTDKFAGDVALTVDIIGSPGTSPSYHLTKSILQINIDQRLNDLITFTADRPGFFIANITGTSGLLAHSTLVSIDVREVHGFSFTPSPDNLAIENGGPSASSQITVKSNNLGDSINLAISCYPDEITANLNMSSIILNPETRTTITLTVSATRFTTPGTYGVSIFGTGTKSLSHNRTLVSVTVTAPTPDFDISSNPGTVTTTAGEKATTTITINPKHGFTDSVNLSTSSPAAGLSASLGASSILGGSGSTTLTINTDASVAPETYILIIKGAGGNLSHSAQVTVIVKTAYATQQNTPNTILGLAPNLFYVIAGVVVAAIVAGVGAAVRMRKPKTS